MSREHQLCHIKTSCLTIWYQVAPAHMKCRSTPAPKVPADQQKGVSAKDVQGMRQWYIQTVGAQVALLLSYTDIHANQLDCCAVACGTVLAVHATNTSLLQLVLVTLYGSGLAHQPLICFMYRQALGSADTYKQKCKATNAGSLQPFGWFSRGARCTSAVVRQPPLPPVTLVRQVCIAVAPHNTASSNNG